ncbi:MAG: PAS domain S-box protein [Desulfatitalea sp.]|nr:PAS domain S-box protein [Desulfatitalea sp.]NNK00007.1 PAS domain S-box protein [Desulfatitalea sp.]
MSIYPVKQSLEDPIARLEAQLEQERQLRMDAESRIRVVVSDNKRLELELIRHRDHFEALVAGRTAELTAANEKLILENRERRLAERERRSFEDQFREASLMLEAMLNAIPDIIGVQDGNHRIIRFNDAGYRFFGKSETQVIGRRCYELFDQDRPCENCVTQQILKTSLPGQMEKYFTFRGTWMDIRAYPIRDMDGRVFRIVEHWRDITALKESQESLVESEEKYRLLVENANEGIFIYQGGQLKFSNHKAREMALRLGLTPQSGKSIDEYICPDDRGDDPVYFTRRLNGQEPKPHAISFRMNCRDGEQVWAELNTVNIKWQGKPATLNFIRDITQSKDLERRFQEAQRLDSLGTLAGGIAHDFNNLLMGIQGNASLMYLDVEEDSLLTEKLKNIEDCVESGSRLTKQLLGFARGGKYVVRPVDMNQILHSSADMFGRTRKVVKIEGDYQDNLWTVMADGSQIEQVLVNLFLNAWQAMSGAGTLYLKTKNICLDDAFTAPFDVNPGRYVQISVTDTGIGMDEATRRRIFEPFFTTQEPGCGTGLGLASVFGIVKNHNGIITVQSRPGQGSTFDVYLPASDKVPEIETPLIEPIEHGTETILLVDDEQYIIDVARLMLEGLGYQLLIADNGSEAVRLFTEHRDEIDLVILDMVMPGMDGEAVFAALRTIAPGVKVVLASGYYVMEQAQALLKDGASDFLQKPFNMRQLSSKIRWILDGNKASGVNAKTS